MFHVCIGLLDKTAGGFWNGSHTYSDQDGNRLPWLPGVARLPMGAKCGKITCCGLWVQRSNPGNYSFFEQSSGVGSREARLPPINGWLVRDKRLTAYTLLLLPGVPSQCMCAEASWQQCVANDELA